MIGHPFRRRPTDLVIARQCRELIWLCALVALSGSGGKDSRAMTILLPRVVPREQLLVIHGPISEVAWPGTIEHIENAAPSSVPLIPARTASGKSLLERIEERGRFPDSGRRYCTSDTKRTPIERELRHYLRAPSRFGNVVVDLMGMRASESPARSKRTPSRSGVIRPAFDSRHQGGGRVPRHRRGRPVAAPGLFGRHVAAQVAASASSPCAPTCTGRRSCVPASAGCTSTFVTPRSA